MVESRRDELPDENVFLSELRDEIKSKREALENYYAKVEECFAKMKTCSVKAEEDYNKLQGYFAKGETVKIKECVAKRKEIVAKGEGYCSEYKDYYAKVRAVDGELQEKLNEIELFCAKVRGDESKATELEELLKRQKAEFDNFRRRSEEEKKSFKLLANEQILLGFLPVFDNFDKAIDVKTDDKKLQNFLEGFRFINKHFFDILNKNQVVSNTKVGDVFDHNIHRALDFEQGDGESDTVIDVYQKGYSFHDKIIRLASVKVSKGKMSDKVDSDKLDNE